MQKNTFFCDTNFVLCSSVVQQFFSFVHFLIVLHWLTPIELGVWAMFLTLISFVETGRLGLIQNTMRYFTSNYTNELPKIATAGLVLSIVYSIIGALVLWILGFILRGVFQMPDLPMLMVGYLILAVSNAVLRFFEEWDMTQYNFKTATSIAFIFGVVHCLSIVYIKITFGILTVETLVLLQIFASCIALVYILKTKLKHLSLAILDIEWLKKMIQFGRYGLLVHLTSGLFRRIDFFLLAVFVPPIVLSSYYLASRFIFYIDFLLNVISLASLPKPVAPNFELSTDEVIVFYEKSVSRLLAFTVPVMVLVVVSAKYCVLILAGEPFLEATISVQILALAGLVKPWGRLFEATLEAVGKAYWYLKMLIFNLFILILFNILLIPRLGTEGAAIATSAAIFFSVALGQVLLRRRIDFKRTLSGILPTYRLFLGWLVS